MPSWASRWPPLDLPHVRLTGCSFEGNLQDNSEVQRDSLGLRSHRHAQIALLGRSKPLPYLAGWWACGLHLDTAGYELSNLSRKKRASKNVKESGSLYTRSPMLYRNIPESMDWSQNPVLGALKHYSLYVFVVV